MKASHCCCCVSHLLASVLLLLLLPELSGPLAVLLQAAEVAPGPGPPDPRPRTLPPLPPGPTAAQQPGRGLAEAAGPRGSEGGNDSSPGAGLEAEDHGGKAGEGSVGGGLAVSPNPGDKPMTQRALTVLMVVSGAVLVYFVVRTVSAEHHKTEIFNSNEMKHVLYWEINVIPDHFENTYIISLRARRKLPLNKADSITLIKIKRETHQNNN
ncbi:hypothetical protein P7K49_005032 [Saguinus oedipus]|uniref:Transmembrane protein 157 n=1 Tax=Saguinus oedipus TaxID=9490 RepID=A0ABQ9W937_SAGOE|nr:hypothetical protein P7K49_005032 [Saguinus oedipus]